MGKARIKCERIDQKMNKERTSKFFEALTELEKENNIGSDILIEKIKSGIEKAIKKDYYKNRYRIKESSAKAEAADDETSRRY